MTKPHDRLNIITNLYGHALQKAIQSRPYDAGETHKTIQDLIIRFSKADPHPGKARTQWLIKTYIRDERFKLEDLGRAYAALLAFEQFKRKLPIEHRELNKLHSLSDLEALVEPFIQSEELAKLTHDLSSVTGRKKRRLEALKARDESIILHSSAICLQIPDLTSSRVEGANLPTIVVPMTEFAACWWGRGTKWCTAAEKNNAFAEYHKIAPLVIIVCSDGTKFQIHVTPKTIDFMDSMDKDVKRQTIIDRWSELSLLLYWMIEQNGRALSYVPDEHKDSRTCRMAVKQNGLSLQFVPEAQQSLGLCHMAVKQNAKALRYVCKKNKTPTLCYNAVSQNGMTLRYVIEESLSASLCRIAVRTSGNALQFVPELYIKPDLYHIAVTQNGAALKYIPESQRTYELCYSAVSQDGLAIHDVPERHRNYKLYHTAIEQAGCVLAFIPLKYKTSGLCRIAVEQNGDALEDVPEKYRTPMLCRIAVSQQGEALKHVPKEHRDEEIYHIAVQNDGFALKYLPEEHLTFDLCCIAVQQNPDALDFVPEYYRTSELMALISPTQPEWQQNIFDRLLARIESRFSLDILNFDSI
jgi:Domain of unknown function (DUF4116)